MYLGCPKTFASKRTPGVNPSRFKQKQQKTRISTYRALLIPLTQCMRNIYCSSLIANNVCEFWTHLICIQYSVLWETLTCGVIEYHRCLLFSASGAASNVRRLEVSFLRDFIIMTWYSAKRHDQLSTCFTVV